jgi:hypothetical protein
MNAAFRHSACCALWVRLDTCTIFLPLLTQGGEGWEEPVVSKIKSEPLAPTLSPFGGERELFYFGAGVKMRPCPIARQKNYCHHALV